MEITSQCASWVLLRKMRNSPLICSYNIQLEEPSRIEWMHVNKQLSLCQHATRCFNYSSTPALGEGRSSLHSQNLALGKVMTARGGGHLLGQPDKPCQSGAAGPAGHLTKPSILITTPKQRKRGRSFCGVCKIPHASNAVQDPSLRLEASVHHCRGVFHPSSVQDTFHPSKHLERFLLESIPAHKILAFPEADLTWIVWGLILQTSPQEILSISLCSGNRPRRCLCESARRAKNAQSSSSPKKHRIIKELLTQPLTILIFKLNMSFNSNCSRPGQIMSPETQEQSGLVLLL